MLQYNSHSDSLYISRNPFTPTPDCVRNLRRVVKSWRSSHATDERHRPHSHPSSKYTAVPARQARVPHGHVRPRTRKSPVHHGLKPKVQFKFQKQVTTEHGQSLSDSSVREMLGFEFLVSSFPLPPYLEVVRKFENSNEPGCHGRQEVCLK